MCSNPLTRSLPTWPKRPRAERSFVHTLSSRPTWPKPSKRRETLLSVPRHLPLNRRPGRSQQEARDPSFTRQATLLSACPTPSIILSTDDLAEAAQPRRAREVVVAQRGLDEHLELLHRERADPVLADQAVARDVDERDRALVALLRAAAAAAPPPAREQRGGALVPQRGARAHDSYSDSSSLRRGALLMRHAHRRFEGGHSLLTRHARAVSPLSTVPPCSSAAHRRPPCARPRRAPRRAAA